MSALPAGSSVAEPSSSTSELAAARPESITTRAARSVGEDGTGTLGVGKRADLTASAVDPLLAPPEEPMDAAIMLTVAEGLIAHGALVGAAWS